MNLNLLHNIMLMTDSYKVSHWKQYPPGTQKVFSFFESRGGKYDSIVFFGLQYIIKKYLVGQVVTLEKIIEAKELFHAHFGNDMFNEEGWRYILTEHNGRLPIEIRAVAEGSIIPTSHPLITVVNTDPKCFWLVNYLETLLVQVWYPMTVATQSYNMRRSILTGLNISGDPSGLNFKLHDFGYRGVSSDETAAIGGCAHLATGFQGTDTVAALVCAKNYYHEPMAGFSIPAAEHSTITSWGQGPLNEYAAYKNMLEQYPTGLVAVVSDSYDIFRACSDIWGSMLHDEVLARDGVLVIRPDSGDPPKVILEILTILGEKFGYETNEKGFGVLNPKVRIIQGDGIDSEMLDLIIDTMIQNKWSIDNIAFGSGGGLLQKMNRDTQKCAFKCSAIEIDGVWKDVIKTPVTDPGKKSKAGLLGLKAGYGITVNEVYSDDNLLKPVFRNGELLIDQTLSEIRERVNK